MVKLSNKKLILYTVIFSSLVVLITIIYNSIEKRQKLLSSSYFAIVPKDASLIINFSNFENIKKIFLNENIFRTSQLFENTVKLIKSIDTLAQKNSTLGSLINKNQITISFHNLLTEKNIPLIIIKTNTSKINKILDHISKDLPIPTADKYQNVNIYSFELEGKTYYFIVYKNFIVISQTPLLLEEVIRQEKFIFDNHLNDIIEKIGYSSNLIIVNHENVKNSLSEVLSQSFLNRVNFYDNFAKWSVYKIQFNSNNIILDGISFKDEIKKVQYLRLLENQKPKKLDILKFLPEKTAEFCSFNISSISDYLTNYEKYLDAQNITAIYINDLNEFKNTFKTDLYQKISNVWDGNFTVFKLKFNEYDSVFRYFVMLKTSKPKDFFDFIADINKNSGQNSFIISKKINNENISIYKIPEKANFLRILFGKLYNIPQDLNYAIIYGKFVYFSSSAENLEKIFSYLKESKTLENTPVAAFFDDFVIENNILYFSNNLLHKKTIASSFNRRITKIIYQEFQKFSKYNYLIAQIRTDKDLFLTNIVINNDPKASQFGISIWEKPLKNTISISPVIAYNHLTHEKNLIIIDDSNYIYRFDKKGNLIWAKKIKEPITSKIYEVDFYNNQKYQVFFSTLNYLITIDVTGKEVLERIKQLPEPSPIGASLLDYEENKNYRIFVTLKDKILLYNSKLEPVKEWSSPPTTTDFCSKVFHFSYKTKDYLVFASLSNVFITDRKGNIRIKVNKSFQFPNKINFYFQPQTQQQQAHFLTTDAAGKIVRIFLNGNVDIKELKTLSANHKFLAADLDKDKNLEYIFAEQNTLYVYNYKGQQIFNYTFNNDISYGPTHLDFGSYSLLGLSVKDDKRIYFFNSKGKLIEDKIIEATGPFVVWKDGKNFILTTSQKNFLINYFFE